MASRLMAVRGRYVPSDQPVEIPSFASHDISLANIMPAGTSVKVTAFSVSPAAVAAVWPVRTNEAQKKPTITVRLDREKRCLF
ncbi:hypothetical protein D3C73_1222890 [compost metagenome]